MLLMYSGLRRGEATALTWADIDLDAGTISVSRSYDFVTRTIKAPKSASGTRVVNIPQQLVTYLRNEKKDDQCLYVLHTASGHMMTHQAWTVLWRSYMNDLNLKYGYNGSRGKFDPVKAKMKISTFTPHQLRHTFASLMYMAGVDVMTAKDQMGHASIKTTLDIYTQLDKKYKRTSMSKLDDFLAGDQAMQV